MHDKEMQQMVDRAKSAIEIAGEIEKHRIPIDGTPQEIASDAIDRLVLALKNACNRNEQ